MTCMIAISICLTLFSCSTLNDMYDCHLYLPHSILLFYSEWHVWLPSLFASLYSPVLLWMTCMIAISICFTLFSYLQFRHHSKYSKFKMSYTVKPAHTHALSSHRKFHMNWTSFKRSPVLWGYFSLSQRWPLNTLQV